MSALGGIGADRCPFFSRLNSESVFNHSDRICARLPIVPRVDDLFRNRQTLSEEVPMKAVYGIARPFWKRWMQRCEYGGTCGLRACLPLVSAIVPARVFGTVREQI